MSKNILSMVGKEAAFVKGASSARKSGLPLFGRGVQGLPDIFDLKRIENADVSYGEPPLAVIEDRASGAPFDFQRLKTLQPLEEIRGLPVAIGKPARFEALFLKAGKTAPVDDVIGVLHRLIMA